MDRLETLAKRVKLSRTSVASYLKWMSGESKSSDKRYFRVVPDFNENALDLQTVDVFLDTPTLESIEKTETLCDKHPYTKYRARCYGGHSKILAQFRIPKNTSNLLTRFLNESKRHNEFEDYQILPTEDVQSLFTLPRLEHWNNKSFTWDFDWEKWASESVKRSKQIESLPNESKLHLLKKSDIAILGRLSQGMRRKQRVIIEELKEEGFDFTSQEFSRRLRILKNHFITRYHVYIDIEAFDLYSNLIITGKVTPKFSQDLQDRLQLHPIPFRSTLKITDCFMFWYLRLPPSHLSQLLNYLYKNMDGLNLSMVDYNKTWGYYIWADAFDDETGGWRKDTDFLLCHD
ncbi:MAG: hypothetical protein ACFFF4_00515 [Candidatus Thorarchaeota archaeon]